MTFSDSWKTYSDAFWGPDFRSVAGAEALNRRNQDGKRMCQDFEDYLRKRAKVENEYSKSLAGLTKCFRERDAIGVLEASFSSLKEELESIAKAHQTASESLHKQADAMKRFREEQTASKKAVEEALNKAQNAKLSQHTKMLSLQKAYVKKSTERDNSENQCKEISVSPQASQKEVDKARNKAIKADDEAGKSDVAYKGALMLLNDLRIQWEHEMLHACQSVQELDERRIEHLRKELWMAVNIDSKAALETDESCEKVRDVLEKCDIISDIQAFIENAATGSEHPGEIVYQHYSKFTSGSDSDSNSLSNVEPGYATVEEVSTIMTTPHSPAAASGTGSGNNTISKFKMRGFNKRK